MARVGFIQDELDLKLLVLYIMARAAAPIHFYQLLDLALCDAGVDYFSLTQVVEHLITTGNLERKDELLAISDKGRRNSSICESSLPFSVRARCDENLIRLNDALRRQEQVQACVTPDPDGTCHLQLRFSDETGPMMELSVLLPDPKQAERTAQRFRQNPVSFYHQITAILHSEEKDG